MTKSILPTISTLAFALAAWPLATSATLAATGTCAPNKVAFATADDTPTTNATAYSGVPGAHQQINTSARGCVIVEFVGEVNAGVNDRIYLRAVASGHGVAEPPEMRLGQVVAPGFFETRAARFVFPDLPAGNYIIKLQWHGNGSTGVQMNHRAMTIHYR